MEFEIWWLLGIPVFFALGWIAARVDIRELLSESRTLPRGYFKGLNLLLNEQPDKAIDAFIDIVKLDPETAEMHFALGNLFRRRGETERAIRVHQNLLSRPDLPPEQKVHAQYELGQDYLKAGLLDLEKALLADRKNVRATMLIGDVHLANGDVEAALLAWRRVEQQSVPHVALVAQRLMDGYKQVGRAQEGVNLLKTYMAEASSIDLLEVVFKAVIEIDGVDAAKQLVSEQLRRTPTLLGLDKLLEARLMDAQPQHWEELSMVKNLVHGYTQKLARYQCSQCGFKARQFYWQCPGCSQWESYPPRRTEELNVMN
ncbi:MAG: lipopolysaccharide assembly protein LapB [Burkholderiales bacterium]|nr:lipopolysaccharide assembly protein LapB [Burkholderiales bacterium]